MREKVGEGISRLRDRRRSTRKRLEEIFDRQTAISILVLLPAGKVAEVWTVPAVAGLSPLGGRVGLGFAWLGHFAVGVAVGVYWEHLARTASEVADKAEEAVEE